MSNNTNELYGLKWNEFAIIENIEIKEMLKSHKFSLSLEIIKKIS